MKAVLSIAALLLAVGCGQGPVAAADNRVAAANSADANEAMPVATDTPSAEPERNQVQVADDRQDSPSPPRVPRDEAVKRLKRGMKVSNQPTPLPAPDEIEDKAPNQSETTPPR